MHPDLIKSFEDLKYLEEKPTIACLDSGGLDSAYLLTKLVKEYDLKIHVLTIDIGQEDSTPIKISPHIEKNLIRFNFDAREEFCSDFVIPLLHAHGIYGKQHPLSASLSRPLIAKILVRHALEHKISTILHAATPSQNSMRRFNGAIKSLNYTGRWGSPYLLDNCSREEKARYVIKNGGLVHESRTFSIDTNIFCREFESGNLLGPHDISPPESMYKWTVYKETMPEQLSIVFRNGIPIKVNTKELPLSEMITLLNKTVGKYKLGRYQGLEEGPSGIKVLEIREAPAAFILLESLKELLSATHSHATILVKSQLEQLWVREASEGRWFDSLKVAIDSFNKEILSHVSGTVVFQLSHLECTCRSVVTDTRAYCIDREKFEMSLMQKVLKEVA